MFNNATLPPGAGDALTLTVRGTIGPSTSGEIANTATVTAGPAPRREHRQQQRDRHRYARHVTDRSGRHEDRRPDDLRAGRAHHLHDHRDQRRAVDRQRLHITDTVPAAITGVTATCAVTGIGQLRHERLLGQHRQPSPARASHRSGQRDHDHGERHRRPDATGDLINTATATAAGPARPTRTQATTARPTPTPRAWPRSTWRSPRPTARRPTCPGRRSATRSPSRTRGRARRPASRSSDAVPTTITGVTAICTATGTANCGTNASAGNNVSFTGGDAPAGRGPGADPHRQRTISPDATGPLVNAATVTAGAGSTDPSPGNNSATDTDTQGATQVDLHHQDGRPGRPTSRGTPITYTIAVTNAGPSHAGSFSITDHGAGRYHRRDGDLRGHRHGRLRHQRVVGQRRQLHQCEPRPGRRQRAHDHHQRHRRARVRAAR